MYIVDLNTVPDKPVGNPFDTTGEYGKAYAAYTDQLLARKNSIQARDEYVVDKNAWNQRFRELNGPPPNMPRPEVPHAFLGDGSRDPNGLVCAEIPDPVPVTTPTQGPIAAAPGSSPLTPWEQNTSLGLSQMFAQIAQLVTNQEHMLAALAAIQAKTDKLP